MSEPGAAQVTTDIAYDSVCGYESSVTVTGKDSDGMTMTGRTTARNFGTRCQFPETITNALNQPTTIAYNYDVGVPITETDPNGIALNWGYDTMGRKTRETRADSTATTWSYQDCIALGCQGTENKAVIVRTELDSAGGTITDEYSYTDRYGRTFLTKGRTVSGIYDRHDVTFDAFGRVAKDSVPAWWDSGAFANGYRQPVYDLLGRATRVQLRSAAGVLDRETILAYEGSKITETDARLNQTQHFLDVRGKLRRIDDQAPAGGRTEYTYDYFANLLSIKDAQNNVTSWGYDIHGFKTSVNDPDMGIWTYAYDSLGELRQVRDAKTSAPNWTTQITYDPLSRPLTRVESEGTSTWIWGNSAAAKSIGQLFSVSGPGGYLESYAYDSLGRPLTTTITSDATYSIDYGYDATTGFLQSTTYPVSTASYRLKTRYDYQNGVLNKISDFNVPATVFWQLNAVNERGQPIDESLGNGTAGRIITGFDSLTGLLMYRQTGTTSPFTNRQNLSFEWDKNDNLKKRIDVNQSNLTEEFYYDTLNRLYSSKLNGTTNLDLSLDNIGNILSKTSTDPSENVGNYTYDGMKKHAVVSTSNGWTFGYDANGNMSTYKGNTLTWYSYNLPNSINVGVLSSQFFYDPNRNRWKQIAGYAGATETTIYVGGILEKVTVPNGTAYRHYISAGSTQVIYTRWSTGANETRYVSTDQLGSNTVMLDSAGAKLADLSYGPFGRRRGSNWTGSPTSGEWTQINNATRHGYTWQEHLDNIGLIHMNGRVQDPVLGRFLSADPLIDGRPGQDTNRYSYVGNNPLTLSDPSGFFGWDPRLDDPDDLLNEFLNMGRYLITVVNGDFSPGVGFPTVSNGASSWAMQIWGGTYDYHPRNLGGIIPLLNTIFGPEPIMSITNGRDQLRGNHTFEFLRDYVTGELIDRDSGFVKLLKDSGEYATVVQIDNKIAATNAVLGIMMNSGNTRIAGFARQIHDEFSRVGWMYGNAKITGPASNLPTSWIVQPHGDFSGYDRIVAIESEQESAWISALLGQWIRRADGLRTEKAFDAFGILGHEEWHFLDDIDYLMNCPVCESNADWWSDVMQQYRP